MAIAIPHKPRYRDRTLPIYYLVGDRMLLRRRPASVHDPRTPAQLRQRLRLRVASRFLKGFRPMVAEGFAPEELDNLRRVGAYQQALGRLMRGALVETPEGVAIDAARVLLSEGYGAPLGAVRARAETDTGNFIPSHDGNAVCRECPLVNERACFAHSKLIFRADTLIAV